MVQIFGGAQGSAGALFSNYWTKIVMSKLSVYNKNDVTRGLTGVDQPVQFVEFSLFMLPFTNLTNILAVSRMDAF